MASDTDRIYIEILETVLMSTSDPVKSALQKLAFLTGSALMELFNVKPAENAVAELLVRGMTPYIWAYLSPRSEPTLAPCTRKPILDIRQSSC
ncbi:transcriptional regulator [Klebsiella pneumoniae]